MIDIAVVSRRSFFGWSRRTRDRRIRITLGGIRRYLVKPPLTIRMSHPRTATNAGSVLIVERHLQNDLPHTGSQLALTLGNDQPHATTVAPGAPRRIHRDAPNAHLKTQRKLIAGEYGDRFVGQVTMFANEVIDQCIDRRRLRGIHGTDFPRAARRGERKRLHIEWIGTEVCACGEEPQ